MAIKLKLEGFEELLKEIERASGSIERSTVKCMEKSAAIMESELKAAMQSAYPTDEMSRLISRMPPYMIKNDHGQITALVGYDKGAYNPDNPSDAYKVAFLNYGTPRRSKHGKIKGRDFIKKAKSKAKNKIQKTQEETLNEILRGLKG